MKADLREPLSAADVAEIERAVERAEAVRARTRAQLQTECGGCWIPPSRVDSEAVRRFAPLPLATLRILRGLVDLSRGPSKRALDQLGGEW